MQSNIVERIITKNKIDAILEYASPSPMMKRNFQTARQRSVGQGTTARKVGTPMKTSTFKKAQDSTITKAKAVEKEEGVIFQDGDLWCFKWGNGQENFTTKEFAETALARLQGVE